MKLYKIYFSPTGGTKKVIDILAGTWQCEQTEIDLSDRNAEFFKYIFQKEDVCLIAVPSFGGRVPEAALAGIRDMAGGDARAVLVAVYGNRAYEDTLLELKDTVSTAGFCCAAAVTANAEHSIMHQFGAGRPDLQDQQELAAFAEKIKSSFEKKDITAELKVPGNRPYREFGGVAFKPTAGSKCTRCGLCAEQCPVGAIPKDDPASVDAMKCISCMRCIKVCPEQVRKLNEIMLFAASRKMKNACSQRKQNELFIR